MKKITVLLITICIISVKANAQNELTLDNLEMPSSPAFILLDVAPTSIERPKTTKAFSTSILNSLNKNNGIPENYAIEFAPFWFFKHAKLNAINYWGFKKTTRGNKPAPFSQARFGNLSFATVKSSNMIDSLGTTQELTNMSFGFRTTLIQIRNKTDVNKLVLLNLNHVSRISDIMSDGRLSKADIFIALEKDKQLKESNEEIKNVLSRKPVFAVDLAGATAWSFSDNNYNSIDVNRMGAWLTLNYAQTLQKKNEKIKNDYLNIYVLARLMQDNNVLGNENKIISSNVFDSGGKIEFELDRLSFSYEYLYRTNLSEKISDSFRSSGLMKYRASDQLLVTGAFGRNFGDGNNLITQIGITWGLNSKGQEVTLDKY